MRDENTILEEDDTANGEINSELSSSRGPPRPLKASDEPKNVEKDILRYYYYIHNGIDTEHVAPLENIRILNTLGLVPDRFRKNHQQSVADLCDEMREDYLLSVKKAIVDFVLRDSRDNSAAESAAARARMPEYRRELEVVPKPWHASFEKARGEIFKTLYSINPCMAQLLKLWYTSYK